jgi:hypothetical protein
MEKPIATIPSWGFSKFAPDLGKFHHWELYQQYMGINGTYIANHGIIDDNR